MLGMAAAGGEDAAAEDQEGLAVLTGLLDAQDGGRLASVAA